MESQTSCKAPPGASGDAGRASEARGSEGGELQRRLGFKETGREEVGFKETGREEVGFKEIGRA